MSMDEAAGRTGGPTVRYVRKTAVPGAQNSSSRRTHPSGRIHSNVDPLSQLPRVPPHDSPLQDDIPSIVPDEYFIAKAMENDLEKEDGVPRDPLNDLEKEDGVPEPDSLTKDGVPRVHSSDIKCEWNFCAREVRVQAAVPRQPADDQSPPFELKFTHAVGDTAHHRGLNEKLFLHRRYGRKDFGDTIIVSEWEIGGVGKRTDVPGEDVCVHVVQRSGDNMIHGTVYNPLADRSGRTRLLNSTDIKFILALVEQCHTIYIDEIQEKLLSQRDVSVSVTTLLRTMRRLEFSRKRVSVHALERNDLLRSAYMNRIVDIAPDPVPSDSEIALRDVTEAWPVCSA
ncbi:hypothetical protein B0H13DRAFT_2321735 [Mycena leptocephala]|nr:hypothetical protein B0H13DRAFT_2321735 [Mycena leptocephala]